MGASLVITLVAFIVFGGRELVRRGRDTAALAEVQARAAAVSMAGTRGFGTPDPPVERARGGWSGEAPTDRGDDGSLRLNTERVLTLVGLVLLAVTAFGLQFDVGFTAIAVAVVLTLIFPRSARGAVDKIAWRTVLLVSGIVTYVNLLDEQGTVGRLGEKVATIGTPLVAALLICYVGAVVSAFASTTGILGALIPLAVPFLLTGQVGAVGLITALAISSSVVGVSPFSTSGALCVANADERDREDVFRKLVLWGTSLVVLAPLVTWLVLVVPGRF
jgi:di/tricarboxylate transporter